ncbi:MAG: PAS domain S-box protein [bacterium]|nr:PAS domain S-box protein [bacterium]
MYELSTSVTSWLLDWLEGHSVSGAVWAEGICELQDLIEPEGFIAWDAFAALCERLADYGENPPDDVSPLPCPAEIGREIADEIIASSDSPFESGDLPIEIVFVEELPAFAGEIFPDLAVSADIASDGEVILFEVAVPDTQADGTAFFELIRGALEAVPLLADHEAADVAMEASESTARYAVRVPGAFENVIPIDSHLDDERIEDRQIEEAIEPKAPIDASVDEPPKSEPQTPIAIDHAAIIERLAACTTDEEIAEQCFGALREHFDCAAGRLWRHPGSGEDPGEAFRFGRSDKPPSRTSNLTVAAEVVAQLEIWDGTALEADELHDLDRLLPVFGLALAARTSLTEAPQEPSNEGALAPILDGTLDRGDDRLVALVRCLAERTHAHTCAISLRSADRPMRLETTVVWKQGGPSEPFEYDAKGTPCAEVLSGEFTCYRKDVLTHFAGNEQLEEPKTESYVGTPLCDRGGRLIGVLCAWSSKPIESQDDHRTLLRLLAERAQCELQYRSVTRARDLDAARYRSVFAASHDLLVEVIPQTDDVVVSPNAEEILGFTHEELRVMNHQDLLHPDDLPAYARAFGELLRDGGTFSTTIRVRCKEGGYRRLDTRVRSITTPDGSMRILAAGRDTSDQITIEQERERLVSIIENSSDLISLLSLKGSVLSLNEAGQRMLGLASEDEARSKTIYDFIHEDNARAMKFDIMPGVHRRRHWDGELGLRHFKTGRRLYTVARMFVIDDRLAQQPLAIALVGHDTTASRERDEALLESEERYRMLAENPYELIAETDEGGRFIYTNPSFESILGHCPESLLGTPANEIIHPDERAQFDTIIGTVLQDGGTWQGELRPLHSDGSYRSAETAIRAYRGANGRMTGVLIARDITERMASTETLRQTQHKLQQSQKMEAIGRMAGGVAHDFNNLLTAITGYCDLLIEDLGPQHPARDDAEEILKASERAAGLTHQLLAFSRRQVLQPRIVDLNNLVADLDRMLRRLIGEDVELVTVLDGAAWPTKADPGQLHQVLLNLVVNSRDAMPKGGRITIETANTILELPIQTELDDIPPGEYVTLGVTDTGGGMDPEIQSMIFEPFFTTKESGKGTGLGLSTVIGIVQQTGGHIEVESVTGRGTSFVIYLPRAEGVAMLPERNLSPDQFSGEETVLVVEDSDPVRKLVVRCLERHGYTVLEAASGTEGLRLSNRHPGHIQLLLSDVVLPRMDGFEVAQRLQAMRPDTRVMFMSGFTDDGLAKHGVDARDIALLEKPFTPSTLLRTVREYLDAGTMPAPPVRSLPEDDSPL